MLLGLLLFGCVPLPFDEDFANSLQIVTVVADPPQVDPFTPVDIEVWVADPFQRGAEVMVWPCSPVQVDANRLRCFEGLDLEGRGVPLPAFTRVGFVEEDRFSVTLLPPIQSVLALQQVPEEDRTDGLPVPMFALACDPGACEIFDLVRADPEPGSEAYARAARLLADPELLADQGPRTSVSLALKFYTLAAEDTPRTSVPVLLPLARRQVVDLDLIRWRFLVEDGSPEAAKPVDWTIDTRYTSGRIVDQSFAGGELEITWSPMGASRDGSMVVAVSDGRGGVAADSVPLPAVIGDPYSRPEPVEELDSTLVVSP